jgi:hypothetical protein
MVAQIPVEVRDRVGTLNRMGFAQPFNQMHSEILFNGRTMPLARWPNSGFLEVRSATVTDEKIELRYNGRAGAQWPYDKDAFAVGYWAKDWAEDYQPVTYYDSAAQSFNLGGAPHRYGYAIGGRFYFLNVLAELDQQGEWYLDKFTGQIFFWPPGPLNGGSVELTVTSNLIRIKTATDIILENMGFDGARSAAVTVEDGRRVWIRRCEVSNVGATGIRIEGRFNIVEDCHIHDVGATAIAVSGGDRMTLEAGGNIVKNSSIVRFGRWLRTYRPAISLSGVGNIARGNNIEDGPHAAILFWGNDHVIEQNRIRSVVKETGDAGAIYTGRDWTARGTVIKDNTIHDAVGIHGIAAGVYLDDQASGIVVTGNELKNVGTGVLVGGGVDNTIANNNYVGIGACVQLDARGMGWQRKATIDPSADLQKSLRVVPYNEEPYTKRYPTLAGILNDDPGVPKRNQIISNRCNGRQLKLPSTVLQMQRIFGNE